MPKGGWIGLIPVQWKCCSLVGQVHLSPGRYVNAWRLSPWSLLSEAPRSVEWSCLCEISVCCRCFVLILVIYFPERPPNVVNSWLYNVTT